MKNLLFTIFSCLLFLQFSVAQDLHITGVVRDAAGQNYAGLQIQLKDTITGEIHIVNSDGNGTYNVVFENSPDIGTILLSYLNCHNVLSKYYLNYSTKEVPLSHNFNYCKSICDVTIQIDNNTPDFTILTAHSDYDDNYDLVWSTGATTNSITLANSELIGEFWVQLTAADGCISKKSIFYDDPVNCNVFINSTYNYDETITYSASTIGSFEVGYSWSNGSTEPIITVGDNELYCVSMTNSAGCIASECTTVMDSCHAFTANITYKITANGFLITAHNTGIGSNYLWSNGSTGKSTFLPFEDHIPEFCVEIAFDQNCTKIYCIALPDPENCVVSILSTNTLPDGTCNLIASSIVDFNNTYLWNTGEISPYINVSTTGQYCVTVTNTAGCSASQCIQHLDSLAFGCSFTFDIRQEQGGYLITIENVAPGPFNYYWSTGENTQSIITQSLYNICAQVTNNSSGCIRSKCVVAQDCNAIIEAELNGPTLILTANTTIANPIYIWSTGENTKQITIDNYGQYCVTVINQYGCSTEVCYDWHAPLNCSVEIIDLYPESLKAVATGVAPFSYYWSTGATTQSIAHTNSAVYVIVTDALGCESSVQFHSQNINRSIQGLVSVNNASGAETGKVYLISSNYDPIKDDYLLQAIDSVFMTYIPNYGMKYKFNNLTDGCYYLKAILATDSPGYQENMPTYYSQQILWSEAACIEIPNENNLAAIILMIPGVNPGGPGFIGGYVSEGAGFTDDLVEIRDETPLINANILLTTLDDIPVIHTTTDSDGNYRFDGLQFGTYKVILDKPGLQPIQAIITIDPKTPSVKDANISATLLREDYLDEEDKLSIYPNPATNELFIKSDNKSIYHYTIQGADGRVHDKSTCRNGIINIEKLVSGIYIISVNSGEKISSYKFVKQ